MAVPGGRAKSSPAAILRRPAGDTWLDGAALARGARLSCAVVRPFARRFVSSMRFVRERRASRGGAFCFKIETLLDAFFRPKRAMRGAVVAACASFANRASPAGIGRHPQCF